MSDIKLISPLLDGFSLGNPISEHHGVRCCPAIKENTDKKYIVKIISIPASQVQMDALLLAGAYKDPADAMAYYSQVGEDIMQEAELLKKLSKLDGFLPYEGWQMEPITRRRLGYEVYLVGSYKRTLDKYLKKHVVTHLEAVNLGLDLCNALSVCREAGSIYVALKPSNIYVSEKKEYKIGDLGFIPLDAMSYTALPEKYHSAYTPPELFDPMASINLTVDTYAVGMILYQLYNDGQLPFQGKKAPDEGFLTPVNADYELAEIIMKAVNPDPEERWTDPKELGKALASYMQRNSVNDIPITPHTPLDVKPEDIVVLTETNQDPHEEEFEDIPAQPSSEVIPSQDPPTEEEASETTAEEDQTELELSDTVPEDVALQKYAGEDQPEKTEENTENAPPEVTEELSEELSKMIAQADDLIAHETPEGINIPEEPDPFAFVEDDSDKIDDSDIPEEPVMEDPVPEVPKTKEKKKKKKKYADPKYKRRLRRFLVSVIVLLVLAIAGMCSILYYQNIYLIPVRNIAIDGSQDQLTISIDTDAKDGQLIVRCIDQYGKADTRSTVNGQTSFAGLQPNTMYTIQLEIDGFHKLTGKTSQVYTTAANTNIVSFTSVAGAEDGSVVLSFTVDGEEPDDWIVFYTAEGEQELRRTFTGHSIAIDELTVGKVYTFRLETSDHISLGGETTLDVLASRLILAEELNVTSYNGTDITISWKTPGDVVVDSWNVRCYNEKGYDETVTVSDTQVTLSGIDLTSNHTVEVTAAGMTQSTRTSITANPLSINALNVDDGSHKKLKLSWDYTGTAPKDGWLMIYKIAGGEKNVVKCAKATAEISPRIPGAKYEITIQAADGTTVFNGTHTYAVPDGNIFNKHSLNAEKLAVDLIATPDEKEWYFESLGEDAIKTTFASGEKISVVMRSQETFYMTGADVDILYVFQDSYGNVIPNLITGKTLHWKDIWNGGDAKNGELDLPTVPAATGNYTLNIYFDGMIVAQLNLSITE